MSRETIIEVNAEEQSFEQQEWWCEMWCHLREDMKAQLHRVLTNKDFVCDWESCSIVSDCERYPGKKCIITVVEMEA